MIYPLTFHPIFKSTIWGGNRIARFKNITISQRNIGESWELSGIKNNESVISNGIYQGKSLQWLISTFKDKLTGKRNYERFGEEFPLLIKLIDATDDLSVQVHPDDDFAGKNHGCKGKTEMWYLLKSASGSCLLSGFKKKITKDIFVKSLIDNSIMTYIRKHKIEEGDAFYIPAGRIHSIGAGCMLAEIQQASDITYRIYDFNRKNKDGKARELHTEYAKEVIDYSVYDDYRTMYDKNAFNRKERILKCSCFTTDYYAVDYLFEIDCKGIDSFIIMICLENRAFITDSGNNIIEISRGETILFPAENEKIIKNATDTMKFLLVYIIE